MVQAPARARRRVPGSEDQFGPGDDVVIAGRRLRPSVVFDTYWNFAARRQAVYEGRLNGDEGPWTDDPIIRDHRFTNCYRAADRVSQHLISTVIYGGDPDPAEVVFRTLLFKMFNKVETWELLTEEFGTPSWRMFDFAAYDHVLGRAMSGGRRLYSAAYVIPPPQFGAVRKHTNHLHLLERMMTSGLPTRLEEARSMRSAFKTLRSYPAMGDFLAFQFLIDLNYSEVLDFNEMDFVVAGPGARDGLRKCFGPAALGIEGDVIRYMADTQGEHFARLGLSFNGLRGRPLQLIDCQNLFCEVDKYARVAHPEVAGVSGRTRIKQKFRPVAQPTPAWFPPKWRINAPHSDADRAAPRAREMALS